MSIKKSSIQQAILEAMEIEKFATEKARKTIEEEMAPKIKQIANEALREFENNSVNEGMNIDIPAGAELTIKMPEVGEEEIEAPVNDANIEADIETETPGDETPEEITNNDNEENMSDIFEIVNEDDAVQPDAGLTADVTAPADATATAPADATPAEEPVSLESVNQKLDDVLAKLDSISTEESAEGEGEGDVSIIEDEPEAEIPATASTEVPAPAPVQEYSLDEDSMEEDVVYEVEDDMSEDLTEYELEEDITEMFNELEGLDEIQIVDEDEASFDSEEDSTVDEIKGISFSAKNRADRRQDDSLNESINKIKAQYVSKVDELSKENVSLKQTIKEYKDSFIVLRKQINEVQIFNAKLAYANKLFTNGGLTNDEKMKIAEQFDGVETIEEAKKLYNNLLSEMKISKTVKSPSIEKLKSVSPAVIKPSNTQTLYESDEMRRMKRLAGIGKTSEE